MRTLLVLRHAKSSWKDAELPDLKRPLNKRGQRDAPKVGRLLRDLALVPDVIITSPARRARDTADKVAQASEFIGEVHPAAALYHEEPPQWIVMLRQLPPEVSRAMIVGHNPSLEEFVEMLTGEAVVLPTAALAQVELPVDDWRQLRADAGGKLAGLWLARELE